MSVEILNQVMLSKDIFTQVIVSWACVGGSRMDDDDILFAVLVSDVARMLRTCLLYTSDAADED